MKLPGSQVSLTSIRGEFLGAEQMRRHGSRPADQAKSGPIRSTDRGKTGRVALSIFMLLTAGCASFAELEKDAKVGAPVPPDTRSVVIYPTAMKPDAIKNVDGLTGAPQLFGRLLQDALKAKRPGWDIRLIEASDSVPDLSIAVTTELVKVDGGSSGLRFWIGLGGAGAATSTVRVSVLDKTGKELASAAISESSECPVGACVESNEAAVQRNLSSLAGDVAEFILDPAKFVKKMR